MKNWSKLWIWGEFQWEVARSSGPGGQNVNRTNSAVTLRFAPLQSQVFTDQEKNLLQARLASRLTQAGELLIKSQESRDQDRNRKNCLEKLEKIISKALEQKKKRIPTTPTRGSQVRRVQAKSHRGEIKKNRRVSLRDED